MEKSGCATVVSVVIGLVFVLGIIFTGGGRGGNVADPLSSTVNVAATLDGQPIMASAIEEMAQSQVQNYAQQMPSLPPFFEASAYGNAVDQQVNGVALLILAERKNVKLDDESIIARVTPQLEQMSGSIRENLVATGKLKADASEADFAAAVKSTYGKTLEELKQAQLDDVKSRLASPDSAQSLRMALANEAVLEALTAAGPVNDETLERSFNSFNCKRVYLTADKHKGENLQELAEKIKKEIDGGLKFEQAMEKYSDEPAAEGKTKAENTFIVTGNTLMLDPDYDPVGKLKPGEIAIVPMGPTISIFKLVGITPETPGDLKDKKEEYRKMLAQQLAVRVMQQELKDIRTKGKLEWKSKGYQVMFDWYTGQTDPVIGSDPVKRKQHIEEIEQRAASVINTGDMGEKAAVLARYMAFNTLWGEASPEGQKAMRSKRIEVLQQVADISGGVPLFLELLDLHVEEGNGPGAVAALTSAIDGIQADFSPTAQSQFSEIQAKLLVLEQKKLIDAEGLKAAREGLNRWRTDKIEADRAAAEAKKAEQEAQKQADAEAKKEREANAGKPKK